MYLGIDFGTSGARAVAIDSEKRVRAEVDYSFVKSPEASSSWQAALYGLIEQIPREIRQKLVRIAIDGTSSTVLLCDVCGNPITTPLLYNDCRGGEVEAELQAIAPDGHLVLSATSSLAKLIWWSQHAFTQQAAYFLHQADWLAFLLHGQLGISDYHNALKLGYDVERLCYPDWLEQIPLRFLLPTVQPPGTPIGTVTSEIARRFDLPGDCLVCTGTTDSIAAFLASGATAPGEAVTSLGSTLALKLLSHHRVEALQYGIYSHRLGNLWLAGGASNTGGAVLRHFFRDEALAELSRHINPLQASPLQYYPLLEPGERFPINDPQLLPNLQPRPDNPVEFLHGLLESIARIEAQGYQLLLQLGATQIKQIYSSGGGAKNLTWTQIRQRLLQVPIAPAQHTAAAYGTALLAIQKTG